MYRQQTDQDEVWFPHDNPILLIKELVWEAGGSAVKWVFCGCAAAGNGILGALEMGCNVLALCQDEHHKEHLLKALTEKGVESIIHGGDSAFRNASLYNQAGKIGLARKEKDKGKEAKEAKEGSKSNKKSRRSPSSS